MDNNTRYLHPMLNLFLEAKLGTLVSWGEKNEIYQKYKFFFNPGMLCQSASKLAL